MKKLNKWYIRIFTLGNKFNAKTFSDNFKRLMLNGIGLFIVVTFTFYVENKGDEYEKKQRYKQIISTIPTKINNSINYSNEYLEISNDMFSTYNNIIERWEVNNDSIFISKFNDEFYSPLAYFFLTQDYKPPLMNFELFKSGDQEFKMLYKQVSDEINEIIDGNKLKNIISILDEEKNIVTNYNELIYEKLGNDYDISNIYNNSFWIDNRRKVQNTYKLKYLIKERARLLNDLINPRIMTYKSFLEKKLIYFDSVNESFNSEKYFLYWRIN